MTSKEALEIISNKLLHESKLFKPELESIKQDLDLLQGFKDNHHSMEKRNIELTTENEKLKKVIEILKDKFIYHFIRYSKSLTEYNKFIRDSEYDELTQEEYNLLKEYLNDN